MEHFVEEIENYRKISSGVVREIKGIQQIIINENTLKLFYSNIRSYSKNIDHLLINLNSVKDMFDFIILGETWFTGDGVGVNINGYSIYKTTRGRNRNDGVLVYVSERVNVSVREVELGDVYGLSVDFINNNRKCNLLTVYRTHDSDLDNFTTALRNYYNEIDKNKTYIFVGDTNADLLRTDNKTERYLDMWYEAGFMCGINEPTRVTSNSKSCIDHVFLHHDTYDTIQTAIVQTEITDHYSVYVELDLGNVSNKNTIYTYINKRMLSNNICNSDWNTIMNGEHGLNESVGVFMNNIKNCVDRSKLTSMNRIRLKPIKPWITESLVRSIRTRDKLSKLVKRQPFNPNLQTYYINYRNQLNDLIKLSKKQYYSGKVQASKHNPKMFWNVINELAGRVGKKDTFPLEQFTDNIHNNRHNDLRKQVANEFNEYFTQVGKRLASAIKNNDPPIVNDSDFSVNSVFTLHTVTEEEVLHYVNLLKGGSAPGYDCVSADFLKEHFFVLGKPLTRIINMSIRTGEFPDAFKIARVVPLHKGNDVKNKSNFRPISLLSVFSKVLEKIIKDQLVFYLESHSVLTNQQFGFRQSKNISDALFNISRNINEAVIRNNRCLLVFFDLAKAFDSVDRRKLLEKLEYIGIKGVAHKWFQSYLDKREQFVTINGIDSDRGNIDYGVVQGSTLGPLLFLIYVNNLVKINITGKFFLFADDTAVFFEGPNWESVFDNVVKDISVIKRWFDQNALTINITKTKFMPISLRETSNTQVDKVKLHSCLNYNNQSCLCDSIDRVNSYKYLGVVFDNRMCWDKQIDYLNNKLRKMIFAFRQLSQVLNINCLRTSYCAFVQSVIVSGIIAWGGVYRTLLNPLEVTQKAILKAALGKCLRYSSDAVYEEMKVFNIRQLYVRTILLFIFKQDNQIFQNITHGYNTRTARAIGIQLPRLTRTFSTTNPFYNTHVIYRNLPQNLRQFHLYKYNTFKIHVNKWLVQIGKEQCERLLSTEYRT